jgi:glycosyltransferase involved in cell wall biosynthesis
MFKGLPFAEALSARGHQVEVLTGFPNYPGGRIYPGYRLRPWQREVMNGIPVTRTALYPSHDGSGLRRALNYLSFAASSALIGSCIAGKPDIVYVYNLVTLGPTARLLRLLRGCRVILDVQDLWPESVAGSGMMRNSFLMSVVTKWCRHEYSAPDRLTVLSPGFKKHLVARGIDESEIEVIYNWCDETLAEVPVLDLNALVQPCQPAGRFNVLFAGTMGKVQGLDTVVEAARILAGKDNRVQFVLMGGGVECERIKQAARGLPNVQFLPRCSPAQAAVTMALADALLVHLKDDPLFSVTIPSKTQAYLYAGKPVLMGVRGDASDLVCRAKAGLTFAPESPDALAEAALRMSRTPMGELQQMGRNGRSFYDAHLSLARGVEHFEEVFRRACGTRSSRCTVGG